MFIIDLITARWKPKEESQFSIVTHASGAKTIPIAELLTEKQYEIEKAAQIVVRPSNSEPTSDSHP